MKRQIPAARWDMFAAVAAASKTEKVLVACRSRVVRRQYEAAVAKLGASLAGFGWRQPLVVDENDVSIVGHARLLAAQRLGLDRVPVHIATGLTPEQVKAYRLMDNRSSQETSWDLDLLPLELSELAGFEFDLALTGFEPDELAAFLAEETEGLTDPDAVPHVPEEPVSKPGDLYLLGCLLYTSPSPRDGLLSRMPSSA